MKKLLIGLILLLLLAAGAWYFASPGYAVMQLRQAAVKGDAEALGERADFESIREGLKADARSQVEAEVASGRGGAPARFGASLALGLIGPVIDRLVTPENVATLVREGRALNAGEFSGTPQSQLPTAPADEQRSEAEDWTIERDGFSRFRAFSPANPNAPVFIFERDGLGWNLTRIDLPGGDLPLGAA